MLKVTPLSAEQEFYERLLTFTELDVALISSKLVKISDVLVLDAAVHLALRAQELDVVAEQKGAAQHVRKALVRRSSRQAYLVEICAHIPGVV